MVPFAVLLTLFLNVVTFLALHLTVPRAVEGNRYPIALPWAAYAVFAHVVPPALTYVIGCIYWRSSRQRIMIAIIAALTETPMVSILRRTPPAPRLDRKILSY
jgi:hypothetical protein